MKRKYTFLIYFMLFAIGSCFAQSLVINEIITSNSDVITDDDNSYEDWIELYNSGDETVNLNGYGLSDTSDFFQWVFPDRAIAPGEHLLIWCSGKDKTDPSMPLHTNFKISADGETITLTAPDGIVADSYAPVILPQNYSYGRKPDGVANFVLFPDPTPGEANSTESYSEILSPPLISKASGFYTSAFVMGITTSSSGATILYTLDGSEPDENNLLGTTYQYKNIYPENPGDPFGSLLQNTFITKSYTTPFTVQDKSSMPNKIAAISSTFDADPYYIPDVSIAKSTVVRAKVIKAGALASSTITRNYFINAEGDEWFSLPVVSLSFDEDQLYDYNNGIYVAGALFDNWRTANPNQDNAWAPTNYDNLEDEIVGNFSYYVDGNEVLNQNVGMVMHGGYTRRFPTKTLRLYARSEYGKSSFDYPFFGSDEEDSFKRILLRNSGNDYSTTYFLDAFIQTSVKHLHFDTQAYQPTVTFINGEYWGLLNLRERYDKKYFEKVYGIEEDKLDHIELSGGIEAKEGDTVSYEALISYVTNNSLAVPENYAYVLTQLDPVNYADYMITEIYVDNKDWPGNNVELFRKRTAAYEPDSAYGLDGRWRWILKDADFGFGYGAAANNSLAAATLENGTVHPNPAWSTILFRKMLESPEFKNYFISRFADLMNTTFLPERLEGIHAAMKEKIAPEIPDHIGRWSSMEGSVQGWNNLCNAIITFAAQRPEPQRDHIMQKFNIPGTANATLDVSDDARGFVKINTIDINPSTVGVAENPYPWTGIYYQAIPVTLKAVALPGYQFSHWTGSITGADAEVTIVPTADFSVMAHFVPTSVIPVEEPIYFWMFDGDVENDTALTGMDATFEAPGGEAVMEFKSCLDGYPFNSTDPNWRKASMERRNSPTDINYMAEANNNIAFADSGMKAIQIKQPFKNGSLENAMVFTISTVGYKNIVFGFAAKDEGAANSLVADYSLDGGETWITANMQAASLELTEYFVLYELDFTNALGINNIDGVKIRIRFDGNNMTIDDGKRVTFNNVSVKGVSLTAGITYFDSFKVMIYPNPASDILTVKCDFDKANYSIFSMDGKQVKKGMLTNGTIPVENLEKGIYLLRLFSGESSKTVKFIKK